ncbi:MAG: hypothetical protein ABIZ80_16470, partial [Bryobacteraceae bacterium]
MAQTPLNVASNATFTEFNVKQDTGVPHFVRLHDKVVEGLESRRQRPTDAGGVLFGTIDGDETCAITVQDFEAISCEHRRGNRAPALECPSQCLEKGIRRLKISGRKNLTAVGYYRPAQRGEFAIEKEDRDWNKKLFAQQDSLLLVTKPDDGLDVGVFFLGVGGALVQDRMTVEFPISLQELCGAPAASAVPVAAGLAALSASSAGSPSVTASTPAPAAPAASSPGRMGLVWKAGLIAVLLVGGDFAFRSMRPAVNGPEVAATAVQKMVPVESAPPAAVPSQPVEQPLAAKDPAPAPSGKDNNNTAAKTSVDNAASGKKDAVIPPSAPKAVTPAPVVVASSVRQSDAPVAAPVQNIPAPAPAAAPAVRTTPVENSAPPA